MKITFKAIVFCVLFPQLLYAEKPPESSYKIYIEKGMSETLPGQFLGTVHLSNPRSVAVRLLGSKLILTGKSEGSVTLRAGDQTFLITVGSHALIQGYKALKSWIINIPGLKVDIESGQLVVQGELLRLADWIEIQNQLSDFRISPLLNIETDASLRQKARIYFENLLKKKSLQMPQIQWTKPLSVTLPPTEKSALEVYKNTLSPYGFLVHENSKLLALEPTIEVEILVAEIRKGFFQKLGLHFPSSYEAKTLQEPVVLHAIETNGGGKILASPRILCKSGKEAHFLAGGEMPIKIVNFRVNDIVWKKYGVILSIKPLADLQGQMSIAIDTEVSMLDAAHTVDGVPGLTTHRISSHFDLPKSKTIALSGLIRSDSGQTKSGLPFLQRIPILGALFSSREYIENRSELVIFVTPRIVDIDEPSKSIEFPKGWNDAQP